MGAPVLGRTPFVICELHDVAWARRALRELLSRHGFEGRAQQELALVLTELGTNQLRHAGRGEIDFWIDEHPQLGTYVSILATDAGRPIENFELALRDGYNDRGPREPSVRQPGLGTGLGAIQRLSDDLRHRVEDGKKHIEVIRYANRKRRAR